MAVPELPASEEIEAEVSGEPEKILKTFHLKSMWNPVPIDGLIF